MNQIQLTFINYRTILHSINILNSIATGRTVTDYIEGICDLGHPFHHSVFEELHNDELMYAVRTHISHLLP